MHIVSIVKNFIYSTITTLIYMVQNAIKCWKHQRSARFKLCCQDIALVCAFSSLFVLAVGTLPPLYHLCLPSLNNMAVLLDGHNNL